MEFEVGDVVKLTSGGPDMTVTALHNHMRESINCAWFDGVVLIYGHFDPTTLRHKRMEKNNGY